MRLRRSAVIIPLTTAAAVSLGAGAFAFGQAVTQQDAPEAVTADTTFAVAMSGQNEVNASGVGGQGDVDAVGDAEVRIDTVTNQVCVDAEFANLDDTTLTGFHIHEGVAGTNGGIVVDFGTPAVPVDNVCTDAGDVADAIAVNPLGYYLNAHNAAYPAGAVRGQLEPTASVTTILPVPARVYDSRVADSAGVPAHGPNSTEVVDLSGSDTIAALPGDATAALVTLTVTDTTGSGYVTAYSNGVTEIPATSTVNWTAPASDVATTTTVKVDANGQIQLTVGPLGGADVIIDVLGYLSAPTPDLPEPPPGP